MWLKKAVKDELIAVTSADKGGGIIIVTPQIIKDITSDKVGDPLRYRPLVSDPTGNLRGRLLDLWSSGLLKK